MRMATSPGGRLAAGKGRTPRTTRSATFSATYAGNASGMPAMATGYDGRPAQTAAVPQVYGRGQPEALGSGVGAGVGEAVGATVVVGLGVGFGVGFGVAVGRGGSAQLLTP